MHSFRSLIYPILQVSARGQPGYFPTCTGSQIRTSLTRSAQDLGPVGRDTKFGFGLVQARLAYDRIRTYGCGL